VVDTVFRICAGSDAHALLASEPFMARWHRLYERCPWATAGQHPEFARCWYRVYQQRETPVIVYEERGQELAGLIALYGREGQLAHVGRHDCEYHVWLALPEHDLSFMPAAIAALDEAFGYTSLELDLLPPDAPLGWLDGESNAAQRCELGETTRRIVRVSDPEFVNSYVRSKSRLRTSMNKLKRTGAVRFYRAADAAAIRRVLTACVPLLEFRKGAVYGKLPFRDEPLRHEFLLAQAEVPGLLHVTALERDGQVLAAHIATAGRRELSIAGIVHSEFEARHSPGALLILELISLLGQEGRELLDFTPGDGEYKERFATETEPVYTLTVHSTRLGRELQRALASGTRVAKYVGQRLPGAVRRPMREIWTKFGIGAEGSEPAPGAFSPNFQELLVTAGSTPTSASPPVDTTGSWASNAIVDLVLYSGERSAYLELLRCALDYIRLGAQMYTRTSKGVLQAACFVLPADASTRPGSPPAIVACELGRGGSTPLRAEWSQELSLLLGPEARKPQHHQPAPFPAGGDGSRRARDVE
jgi:CelD/BcsL family acetyltransferase involved in cellulose biosynthesis